MATNGEPLTKEDLAALALQLDDARAELIEEAKQRFDQLWTFLQHPPESPTVGLLEEVIAVLRPASPPRSWWHICRWPATVAVSVAVGCALGWWVWGASASVQTWSQLGQRMDHVVVEHYLGLSASAQHAVNGVYRQLRMQTPGDRKGKKL